MNESVNQSNVVVDHICTKWKQSHLLQQQQTFDITTLAITTLVFTDLQ